MGAYMTDGGIYMSKHGQVTHDIISEFLCGKLKRREAAELLNVKERTVTRIARRIESKGLEGVAHGNREREPWNKKDESLCRTVMDLVKKKYFDFNMSHCLEMLKANEAIEIKYTTFRRWCHKEKMVKHCKKRRAPARNRRVRMANEGYLLQMDGSPHHYNGKDEWCLIGAIDDATSEIAHAEFFLSEDTLNCMTVLQRIIEKKGLPYALYVDKAGCLGGGKRAYFNQFKRACTELGIRIIFASSAEGKGRIERVWNTVQDRIIPEMRLRKIIRMPAANDFLQTQFLPNYWNTQNTVVAKSPESRYRPLHSSIDLKEIFCLKEHRTVARDHTVSWDGITYQLQSPLKYSIYRQKIEIRTYQDLTWQAFFAAKPIDLIPVQQNQYLRKTG